jgi:DUF4097 and DUF4098 domain-containing protein YvlB
MRTGLLLLAALASLPFQWGCELEGFLDSDRYREDFQYTHNLKPGGRLSLENFNGSVEILSWEKDSVQISGTKYAATESDLKEMKIETQAEEGAVRIRTVRPSGHYRNMGARYFVRVPRQVQLERVVSSNGSIRVEDVEGSARLETSNGSVRLRKLAGRLEARTSNGSIEGDEVSADAVLRTSNGAIRLTQTRGSLDAATSNGSINARFARVTPQKAFRCETSNGSIDLGFEALEGNEVRASTSNSSITVRLPATAKAQIRAHTSHGSVTSDFDVTVRSGTLGKDHLEGQIGEGGPLVQLTTSNGSIRILRL